MRRTLLLASAAVAVLSVTPRTWATPRARPGTPTVAGAPAEAPHEPVELFTASQAVAQIKKIAAWDVTMQATDCTDPEAGIDAAMNLCERGGIIEVESGPGHSIVESDNTQQAIGLWSENLSLDGVSHSTNITLAFDYLATHPGYLEWRDGNDKGPDYYSVYNCGWGVRAVLLYEKVTKDTSHHAYGVACASHIATYAAGLVSDSAELLDVGPAGWAASGLWAWGDAEGDAASKTSAAAIGAKVKSWLEVSTTRFSDEQWAMTGGAAFYGVVESYMLENPGELVPWVARYAPDLGGWIDASKPQSPNDWTDWRNALSAWNMLAQFTAARALGPSEGRTWRNIGDLVLTRLVAQADPTTGAIPGSEQRPSTEAESWITAYMVYFGLLEVIADPGLEDAGTEGGTADGAPDAGTMDAARPPRDATAQKETSSEGPATPSSGGCSCDMAGLGEASALPFGSAVAVLLFGRRRRRARSSARATQSVEPASVTPAASMQQRKPVE